MQESTLATCPLLFGKIWTNLQWIKLNTIPGHIKIGRFNARRLLNCVEEVGHLLEEEVLEILIVTETSMTPEKSMPLGWEHESGRVKQPFRAGMGTGGVLFIFPKGIQYRLMSKIATKHFRRITILVGDVTIVGIYIHPHRPRTVTAPILDNCQERCSGRTVLMGDLHARHKTWCRG